VMLWDQGTWKPESEDVDGALKKGDLKFTLDGYKLKGSWVLVRTGGRYGSGDARSWLLIKHKDEWAGELDITEFAPRSVKSEGDFEDILAADKPDVWQSNRPAKGGEAGAMLATIIERAAALKAGTKPAASSKRPSARATKAPAGGTKPRSAAARTRKASDKPRATARARARKP
jgi:bifunctional non-homologous end joining protein LigD